MTTIEQLLGDLLLRHNCVIIPQFGGFVAQKKAAKIDYSSGRIYPPSKALLFNKQLVNNDGLFVNELSRINDLSYNDAALQVKSKVEGWNKILKSGGRIEVERVGYLYENQERNLCFEQDRFFNLLLESFGLGKIHFLQEKAIEISVSNEIKKEKEPIVITKLKDHVKQNLTLDKKAPVQSKDKVIIEHPAIQRKQSKAWRYIAAACILPIAFYSIWIPMKTDVLESGVLSVSDFNPFNQPQESKYNRSPLETDLGFSGDKERSLSDKIEDLPADVKVYTYKYDDELYVPVNIESESAGDVYTIEKTNPSIPAIEANVAHFIVGCFGEESNAKNLVLKLKADGLDARIVDVKNGLHRVSAGSAISIEGLQQIRSSVTERGYRGWVLK